MQSDYVKLYHVDGLGKKSVVVSPTIGDTVIGTCVVNVIDGFKGTMPVRFVLPVEFPNARVEGNFPLDKLPDWI